MDRALAIDPEDLVKRANDLDPLPPSAGQLAGMLTGEDWDPKEVEQVIRFDEVLTARVLRAANSAAAGSQETVVSVSAAVLRLGAGTVLGLAVSDGVKSVRNSAAPAYGLSEGELWRHSVCAALASDLLRRHCSRQIPAETFAAALLHDVGKLLIARHVPEGALGTIRWGREQGLSDADAESRVLHFSHATLGGVVASSWKLPPRIVRAIATHHEPPGPSTDVGVLAVQMADAVSKAVTAGLSGESVAKNDPIPVRKALDMQPRDYGQLCVEANAQLAEVMQWYE
jgi:putative nucleotidyltransferase with HDIG domain